MQRSSAIALLAIALLLFFTDSLQAQGAAYRISSGLNGADPDWLSVDPVLSSDGRFIAFQSYASNLVADDTNGCSDVFLYDRDARTTVRVSVGSNGTEGNGYSGEPAISPDGRFVAFRSDATNLVSGDTNGVPDVFIYDRFSRRTNRVSMGTGGTQPNGPSGHPSVSQDGRYVAFESEASNLVGDDRNQVRDVFVRDRSELNTFRVSTSPSGEGDAESGAPCISADGRLVVFESKAKNFAHETKLDADVFLFEVRSKKLMLLSADPGGAAGGGEAPVISRDGSVVVFESAAKLRLTDQNPDRDVYAYRVPSKQLVVASVSTAGLPGRSWMRTPEYGPATRIPADSAGASISADGRYVAFVSLARELAPGAVEGAEVYVRDLVDGTTRCITEGPGRAGPSPCAVDSVVGAMECPGVKAFISGNGLLVGIQTRGAFLPADKNESDDIYLVEVAMAGRSADIEGHRKPEQGFSIR